MTTRPSAIALPHTVAARPARTGDLARADAIRAGGGSQR
jgi:hypothetical protein